MKKLKVLKVLTQKHGNQNLAIMKMIVGLLKQSSETFYHKWTPKFEQPLKWIPAS